MLPHLEFREWNRKQMEERDRRWKEEDEERDRQRKVILKTSVSWWVPFVVFIAGLISGSILLGKGEKEREMSVTVELENKWEQDQAAFTELSKIEFDKLCRTGAFIAGPMVGTPSKWMREFGPYNPHRWAFGELSDGRFVSCNTAAEFLEPHPHSGGEK